MDTVSSAGEGQAGDRFDGGPLWTDRFEDLRLSADTVRAHSRQGGPIGGATAAVLVRGPNSRARRPGIRSLGRPARSACPRLYLVIEAPTWRLVREVGSGCERAAHAFAAEVNWAARIDASTWWPLAA